MPFNGTMSGGRSNSAWEVNGTMLTHDEVAGAPLVKDLGRRFHAKKDPRYASSPSFSFGSRSVSEINSLAHNRPFFCKTGTHRCPEGELLLGSHDRRRDDKAMEHLRSQGRHWKVTPGP